MKTGTVTFFNKVKGYGFIKGEDGKDTFVHATNILMDEKVLYPGQKVEFEIVAQRDNKEKAFNVSVVE